MQDFEKLSLICDLQEKNVVRIARFTKGLSKLIAHRVNLMPHGTLLTMKLNNCNLFKISIYFQYGNIPTPTHLQYGTNMHVKIDALVSFVIALLVIIVMKNGVKFYP